MASRDVTILILYKPGNSEYNSKSRHHIGFLLLWHFDEAAVLLLQLRAFTRRKSSARESRKDRDTQRPCRRHDDPNAQKTKSTDIPLSVIVQTSKNARLSRPPSRGSHFESDGDEEAYFNPRRLLFTNSNVDTNISSRPQVISLDIDVNAAATDPATNSNCLIIQLPWILLLNPWREIPKSLSIVTRFF